MCFVRHIDIPFDVNKLLMRVVNFIGRTSKTREENEDKNRN